jgi:Domain of unknown function (DUF6265)
MNKYNTLLAILTTASLLQACQAPTPSTPPAPKYPQLEKAGWLLGTWQNQSPEGVATEVWKQENDSVYAGSSHFVIGQDTVSSESIRLEASGQSLAYVPTVKGQNNDAPVRFTLSTATDKQMVFENPAHDFPQKISYTLVGADSLVAEISGTVEGQAQSQAFPMKRVR